MSLPIVFGPGRRRSNREPAPRANSGTNRRANVEATRVETQSLRRRAALGAACGIFITGIAVAAAGMAPLYRQLYRRQTSDFLQAVQVQAAALDRWFHQAEAIAWQIGSRTRIREDLVAYNRGERTREELAAFSAPKLADALNSSEDAVAIVRYDARGERVVRAGADAVPEPMRLSAAAIAETRSPTGDPVAVGRAERHAGRLYFTLQVPVVDPPSGTVVGFDVVWFRTSSLREMLARTSVLKKTGQTVLVDPAAEAALTGDGRPLAPALREAVQAARSPDAPAILRDAEAGAAIVALPESPAAGDRDPGNPARLVAVAPLASGGWQLAIARDRREIYAPLRGKLLSIVLLTVVLGAGQTAGLLLLLRPLVGRVLVRSEGLEKLARRLQSACEQSPVSIVITDANGTIEYVNPKFEAITGYSAAEAVGQNPRLLQSGYTSPEEYQTLWNTLLSGQVWMGQFHNRRKDGTLFWESATIAPVMDPSGRIANFVGIKEDITQRKRVEAQLLYQAERDPLTGLVNRSAAFARLDRAIAAAADSDLGVGLVLLDLDRFRAFNDTLGFAAGDRLLQQVGQRLAEVLDEGDLLARVGSDEFVAIATDADAVARALALAARLVAVVADLSFPEDARDAALREPRDADAGENHPDGWPNPSASAGVACYPNDGTTASELVCQADAALQAAKRDGGNGVKAFSIVLQEAAHWRFQVETGLRSALARGEIAAAYQPLVSLHDGRIVGVEALMRWHSQTLGRVPPDRFIPVAEETGSIAELGLWMIDRACQDWRTWTDGDGAAGEVPLRVAVNLSPRQLQNPALPEAILEVLAARQLPPSQLELEIVERSGLDNLPHAADALGRLCRAGVRLAIDDFGTGYGSLSYLQQYPFSTLKIDRLFVSALPGDREAASLVRAMLAMARALGLATVAEGIETAEQAHWLAAAGCQLGQGYWFGKPQSAAELAATLERWRDRSESWRLDRLA